MCFFCVCADLCDFERLERLFVLPAFVGQRYDCQGSFVKQEVSVSSCILYLGSGVFRAFGFQSFARGFRSFKGGLVNTYFR
jgi:hypothetical protein